MRPRSWKSLTAGVGVLVAVGSCFATVPSSADPSTPPPSPAPLPPDFQNVPALGEIQPGGDDAPTGQNNDVAGELEDSLLTQLTDSGVPADAVRVDRDTMAVTVEIPQSAGKVSAAAVQDIVNQAARGLKGAEKSVEQPVEIQIVPSAAAEVALGADELRPIVSRISGSKYSYVEPNLFEGRREIVILVDASVKSKVEAEIAGHHAHEVANIVVKSLDEVGSQTNYARNNTTAPYRGGSTIIPNSFRNGLLPDGRTPSHTCTSGPLVQKLGTQYMLTTAHCFPSDQTPPNELVYHRQYNSYSRAFSDVYMGYVSGIDRASDLALVTGSYQAAIWNGAPDTNTAHLVNYRVVSEKVGDGVCASGASTGQTCRNKIVDLAPPLVGTSSTVRVISACSTEAVRPAKEGDSGGPVFHSNSAGKFYIHGIVQGSGWNPATNSYDLMCVSYIPMWQIESKMGAYLITTG